MKICIVCVLLAAQTTAKTTAEAMKEAADKQRIAARKQVPGPVSGPFFTTAWLGTTEAPATPAPDCASISPELLAALIAKAAAENSVDALLIRAMIHRESAGKPCAVSNQGAQGLMQLMPPTQSDLGVTDPFDPAQNVAAGTRYLKQMLTRYNGNVRLALAAYNAGPNRVEPGGGVPAIPETQAYVSEIFAAFEAAKAKR